MTKNIVSVAAALLGAGALLTSCNFDQPEPGCIVQDASLANWYAKYDLVEGQTITEACQSTIIKGETLGVFKFTNPEPGQEGQTKLTIRPNGLASRGPRDPGDPYLQTAVGSMVDEPDAGNFCGATNFSDATVNAASTADEAATLITYKFDNVKVYSAADTPGTQLTGELTYTRDGCTSRYTVRATWPAVSCEPGSNDPRKNCGAGSGTNPDFDLVCDPVLKFCVANGDIPALRND